MSESTNQKLFKNDPRCALLSKDGWLEKYSEYKTNPNLPKLRKIPYVKLVTVRTPSMMDGLTKNVAKLSEMSMGRTTGINAKSGSGCMVECKYKVETADGTNTKVGWMEHSGE